MAATDQAALAVRSLRAVKLAHTAVWACFAAAILAIPPLAWIGAYGYATVLIAIVLVEVAVLAVNRWACPLTAVAARYTDDRRPNFDIYLPVWLALHNKVIFGSMYVVGIGLTCMRWVLSVGI